jgi:Tfp pilus assembly protein PilP
MMNRDTQEKMERLIRFLAEDFDQWVAAAKAKAKKEGKELFFTEPPESKYAAERLGVDPASFSRWKSLSNPINETNLLLIAINTQSVEPLRIFNYRTIDDDLQDVIVNWRVRTPEERQKIVHMAMYGSEGEPRKLEQTA